MVTTADVDLTDPELYARGDPYAVWTLLRAEAPVFRHPQRSGPGFWCISRYEDVDRVSRDPRTFISAGGMSTRSDPLQQPDPPGTGRLLVTTDPPEHTKLRALVNKAFTPRMVGKLEPAVRGVVRRLLDRAGRECDFAQEVSARLPFTVICELLGVPEERRGELFRGIEGMMAGARPEHQLYASGDVNVSGFFVELIEQRRADPRDDLITALVGAGLDLPDLITFCGLLFVAGSETTMNAISDGLLALIRHPDQRERLRADPALWPSAVEEVLRWSSPVLVSMIRTAAAEVELRGQTIRRGDKLALWYPSANRDEDVFPDPDHFDVGRMPNDHLAFGAGAHYCLGAALARLEIQVILEKVLDRFSRFELTAEPRRLRSNIFWGISSLPVRLGR